jgi:outer membrane protein TolC
MASFITLSSLRWPGLLLAALSLSGCALFTEDGGMSAVQGLAANRLGKDVAAIRSEDDAALSHTRVKKLLAQPLSADAAVQVALLNNRDLQAAYNALGMAEARRVRASLPENPVFSLSKVSGGGAFEIERSVAMSVLSLATLPLRADIATDRFHQAQLRASSETIRVANETRRAWVDAVAARALAGFLGEAQSAAQAAADLSKQLGQTGAINKLDQARNQVFYAELTAQLGQARQRVESTRERLIRLMGLWGDDLAFRLPADLPALPSRPRVMEAVEVEAVRLRLDLEIARLDLEALAKSYNLSGATRFISLLDVAGISKRVKEPGGEAVTERGAGVDVQIPIFDLGEANVREAEQAYGQAVNVLIANAVSVRSEAREAYQGYRASYDIARHYQREILPLRKVISDETLLRYNAMQIDVFALLAEGRARIQSTTAAIEANRDFRLAEAALAAAVIGGAAPALGGAGAVTVATAAPEGGH